MDKTRIAAIIVIVGVVIGLVGLLVDVIGLGGDPDKFGSTQTLVTVVGVVVIAAGIAFYYFGDRFMGSKPEDE